MSTQIIRLLVCPTEECASYYGASSMGVPSGRIELQSSMRSLSDRPEDWRKPLHTGAQCPDCRARGQQVERVFMEIRIPKPKPIPNPELPPARAPAVVAGRAEAQREREPRTDEPVTVYDSPPGQPAPPTLPPDVRRRIEVRGAPEQLTALASSAPYRKSAFSRIRDAARRLKR